MRKFRLWLASILAGKDLDAEWNSIEVMSEKNRDLSDELSRARLDLKIARMYADDDPAIDELIESVRKKEDYRQLASMGKVGYLDAAAMTAQARGRALLPDRFMVGANSQRLLTQAAVSSRMTLSQAGFLCY